MIHRLDKQPLNRRQEIPDGGGFIDLQAERDRVDEQPNHVIDARKFGRPAGDGHAETNVLLVGIPAEEQSPDGLKQRADRDAAISRERGHGLRKPRGQNHLEFVAPGERSGLHGTRAGQLGWSGEVRQPGLPERFGCRRIPVRQPIQVGSVQGCRLEPRHPVP